MPNMHVKFLPAQCYAAVVSPEGGTGTTANTALSACSWGSRLVFTEPYLVTDPLQGSHQTFCNDQCHQNRMQPKSVRLMQSFD